jgi:FimV-like protein
MLAFAGAPIPAHALGFGALTLNSYLHEPLKAQVPLVLAATERAESITVELAGPADYRQLNLQWHDSLNAIRVLFHRDASRAPTIKLRSVGIITSPLLSIVLKARKAGRGTYYKHFKVLLDPAPASPVAVSPVSGVMVISGPILLPVPSQADEATELKGMNSTGWARSEKYGPTRSGDSLSEIASRLRKDERWSNSQVALALYEKNRAAFIDGDINHLRRGAWLATPSGEEIGRRSVAEAAGQFDRLLAKSPIAIEPGHGARADSPEQGPKHNIHVSLDKPAEKKEQIRQQAAPSGSRMSGEKSAPDKTASDEPDIKGLGQSVAGLSQAMAGLRKEMQALKREVALIKAAPASHSNSSPDYWMLAFFISFFVGLGVFIALFYQRRASSPWKNPVLRDVGPSDQRFADSAEQFKPAVPHGDEQLASRIEKALDRGEYDKAEQMLLKMEGKAPDSLRAAVLRARLYHESGEIEQRNKLINDLCEASDEQRWKHFCHLLPPHVWNACFGDGDDKDAE